MRPEVNNLIKQFDMAIEHKGDEKFSKDDVDKIFEAAEKVFSPSVHLQDEEKKSISNKFAKLADIGKNKAKRTLEGGSRAIAIKNILQNKVQA